MASRHLLILAIFVALRDQFTEGKSLGKPKLKDHSIEKRSSYFMWQDTCPPPNFLSVAEVTCEDTCHSDDDCIGSLLCCDNGCKMCMDPVLPPPVIDWLGSPSTDHRGFAPGGEPESNYIDLKEPHYEEVECLYNGTTFARGETFLKGCHKCHCNIGGISCEVGPCKIDKNQNVKGQAEETSGEDVSRMYPEALELSGDADNQLGYPNERKTTTFESLARHREIGEGRAKVRIIPSALVQRRPSWNGEDIEHSGKEENKDVSGNSGEDLENSEGHRKISKGDIGHSGGDGENEEIKVKKLTKLRRIFRNEPKKDEELHKNALII